MPATAAERLQQLERLTHCTTRYEAILTNGSNTFLLGYTARHSRSGLLHIMRARGRSVIDKTAMPETAVISFDEWKTHGFDLGFNSWRVRFSGRTQRESIASGEHDYIG